MATPPLHRCEVHASPWPGVYATSIASARHYGRHSHATYGIGVVEQGAHRSSSGRGTVDAHAGDIVTTNPGELHDGRPLGGPTRLWHTVYLEPQVLAGMRDEPPGDIAIAQPAFRDPELRTALRALVATLREWRGGSAEPLACEEALVRACGLLLARHTTSRGERDAREGALPRVRDRLRSDLLAPPTLAELAAMAGLSRFQLLRRFASRYGSTPHVWLVQQRAEHARALIRGGASLADAAAASGFSDQSHLTRVFTRQFGFTPGAWQRAQPRPQ